jgi:hypothetical protein
MEKQCKDFEIICGEIEKLRSKVGVLAVIIAFVLIALFVHILHDAIAFTTIQAHMSQSK